MPGGPGLDFEVGRTGDHSKGRAGTRELRAKWFLHLPWGMPSLALWSVGSPGLGQAGLQEDTESFSLISDFLLLAFSCKNKKWLLRTPTSEVLVLEILEITEGLSGQVTWLKWQNHGWNIYLISA